MSQSFESCDVIIAGGGPAGATAAIVLARGGAKVILLEKTKFPRFHIGESFLPRTFLLMKELNLLEQLRQVPHVPKFGAEFVTADGTHNIRFNFSDGFSPIDETFNIERSVFDDMLLREAEKSGALVRQKTAVKEILKLEDGDVRMMADCGEIRGKWLIDASGQNTLVGRYLNIRKSATEKYLRKAAYFNQFQNVWRPPGRDGGHPLIVMTTEGWFWMIPLDERKTSVGMVMDPDISKQIQREQNVSPDRMLAWGIARCPAVKERMKNATGPETNMVTGDFSYRCKPYVGPGYFMVGDAAAFMDPIFSTGVCVGMTGGHSVAKQLLDLLAGKTSPKKARATHLKLIEGATGTLFKIIRQYYDHSFRELFLEGQGPLEIHKAVIGVLAGNVFPKPPWKLRWRLCIFSLCVKLNHRFELVPRRDRFSLIMDGAKFVTRESGKQTPDVVKSEVKMGATIQ
jgi:flavin-dependent dehydrogenase